MYHVIMCGGIGSRFWPMSTHKVPKQFLKLVDNKSLLRLTVDRLLEVSSIDKILLITSKKYKELISADLPDVPQGNILYEPSPMNTAPAIYLASKYVELINSKETIGIYPADHYIKDISTFKQNINDISQYIDNNSKNICTLGIKPSYPSTSYGYIECEKNEENGIYSVSRFKEKPNLDTAKELVENDQFVWNSGMFFFNVSTMIAEMDRYVPKLSNLYSSIDYDRDNFLNKIDSIWNDMPKISIDYAVMEKSDNICCMKSDFGWSDLGTWVALHELLEKDTDGNVLNGNILKHDAKNNLIFSDSNLVTVVGLDNVGVINYNGKILVIDLEKSEEVRYLIEQLDNKDK